MHVFTFDGISSTAFEAYVWDEDVYSSPSRDYTTSAIPGRNGDAYQSNHRLTNVQHSYHIIIKDNFEANYQAMRGFLLSRVGYCRLEDSVHPNEYYMAVFDGSIQPTITRDKNWGKFVLTFTRKPQRWLKSGEEPITLSTTKTSVTTQTVTVHNPTYFSVTPRIDIYGSVSYGFTLSFGDNIVKLDAGMVNNHDDDTLQIDLESLQAVTNTGFVCTDKIQFTMAIDADKRFKLLPGDNTITLTARPKGATLIPRWYTV